MIEETGTSGYESTEEMTSSSIGTVRRSRDSGDEEDVTFSGTGKRRRLADADVEFSENVSSNELVSVTDHHHRHHHHHHHHRRRLNSMFICSINADSISDLKAECVSETDNDDFSREASAYSVVCLESEEMELLTTVTGTKKTMMMTTTEATSRRKPPSLAVIMPSAEELEEFFSKAEKYKQKQFVEKYNFDIMKDVPMEGRYQWVPLKP